MAADHMAISIRSHPSGVYDDSQKHTACCTDDARISTCKVLGLLISTVPPTDILPQYRQSIDVQGVHSSRHIFLHLWCSQDCRHLSLQGECSCRGPQGEVHGWPQMMFGVLQG